MTRLFPELFAPDRTVRLLFCRCTQKSGIDGEKTRSFRVVTMRVLNLPPVRLTRGPVNTKDHHSCLLAYSISLKWGYVDIAGQLRKAVYSRNLTGGLCIKLARQLWLEPRTRDDSVKTISEDTIQPTATCLLRKINLVSLPSSCRSSKTGNDAVLQNSLQPPATAMSRLRPVI